MLRGDVVQHVNGGAMIGSDSSGQVIGNVVHDGVPGMAFNAGMKRRRRSMFAGNGASICTTPPWGFANLLGRGGCR